MALVKCRECGKEISDQAAACIGCGAPLRSRPEHNPSAARRSDEGQYRNIFPDMPEAHDAPPKKSSIGALVVSAVVIGFVAYACTSSSSSSKSDTASEMKGLFSCQQAIRMVASDPDKADIPYAEPRSAGSEYTYAWTNGSNTIRLRNGLGIDKPASATCTVSKESGLVRRLIINGRTVLDQ